MGGKNTQGGKKTRTLARRTRTIKIAEKLDAPAQLFGMVIECSGNHYKIRCSDNIIRVAPKNGSAIKIKPRLNRGSFVIVDSTDKKACSILSAANPPQEYMDILNPNNDEDLGVEFTTQTNEFSEIIKKQNSSDASEPKKSSNSTKSKGYNNLDMMPEYDSDEESYESEEEIEVDKHGNTIEKNTGENTGKEEEPEVKVNKSTKSKKSDEPKNKKSPKAQKISKEQVATSSNSDSDDSDVDINDL